MTDYAKLLRKMIDQRVEFIIIGGAAAVLHGSSRLTQDLDLVYRRTPENIARLVQALAGESPYPRDAPPGLPFQWSAATLLLGLNFTLQTAAGQIDLFGEVAGGDRYEDLLAQTLEVELFGIRCLCLGLEALIRTKRAAGRPRDLEAVAELEAIREERRKG